MRVAHNKGRQRTSGNCHLLCGGSAQKASIASGRCCRRYGHGKLGNPLRIIAAAEPDKQFEEKIRGRAWRRSKSRAKSRRGSGSTEIKWSSEKNWKLMYTRSEKLHRAKQLGIEYPKRTVRQTLDEEQPQDE